MERNGHLNTGEVVGIAAASAAALGGIIVTLGRAQQHSARERAAELQRSAAALNLPELLPEAKRRLAMLSEEYPAVRESAAEALERARARARVLPAASDVTELAASRAAVARDAGTDALEKLRETLIPVASSALETLSEQASQVRERGSTSGSGIAESSSRVAEVAVERTKSATGDLLATLGWLVAAFTLVYVVLLDDERRAKLRSFIATAIEQGQLLRADFAGYDDEI